MFSNYKYRYIINIDVLKGEGGDGPWPPLFGDVLLRISQSRVHFSQYSPAPPRPPLFEFVCTPLIINYRH